MSEQVGLRGLIANLRQETPYWVSLLPQLPRLLHSYLSHDDTRDRLAQLQAINKKYRNINTLLSGISIVLAAVAGALLVLMLR